MLMQIGSTDLQFTNSSQPNGADPARANRTEKRRLRERLIMIDHAGSGCSGSSVVADFASLLLSSNVPLLYVAKQLSHAKATTTLDHYAKW